MNAARSRLSSTAERSQRPSRGSSTGGALTSPARSPTCLWRAMVWRGSHLRRVAWSFRSPSTPRASPNGATIRPRSSQAVWPRGWRGHSCRWHWRGRATPPSKPRSGEMPGWSTSRERSQCESGCESGRLAPSSWSTTCPRREPHWSPARRPCWMRAHPVWPPLSLPARHDPFFPRRLPGPGAIMHRGPVSAENDRKDAQPPRGQKPGARTVVGVPALTPDATDDSDPTRAVARKPSVPPSALSPRPPAVAEPHCPKPASHTPHIRRPRSAATCSLASRRIARGRVMPAEPGAHATGGRAAATDGGQGAARLLLDSSVPPDTPMRDKTTAENRPSLSPRPERRHPRPSRSRRPGATTRCR